LQARNAWPPLLVAAGLVAGLVAAALEPTLYRSQVSLVIERNGNPATDPALARSFAELASSTLVLRNVSQKLGVPIERDRLDAHAADGVLELAYDAGSRVQAARIAQQVAVEFSGAVASRFSGGGVSASVFDPPHDAGRVSPHILREAGLGLFAGLVAGAIAWRRPRARGLREGGRWRVSALEAAVEAAGAEHSDRVEDWRAYIAVLRGQAEDDLLPYAFDRVVREVFAPLLPGS
jgi:hypothetical protein